MEAWDHQKRGVADTLDAIGRGERRICLTSPTGGGKTWMMATLARDYLDRPEPVVLYTNRKLLLDQTSGVLEAHGLPHGLRAAGHAPDLDRPFQVASAQTENSRTLRKGVWRVHPARLVLVDEAHSQTGATMEQLLQVHLDAGAAVVGLTATPIGLGAMYSHLVVAGTNSELRSCGAIVPCRHYGPDEPDLSKVGRVSLGEELSEQQNVKAMMTPCIFARVFDWWRRLNPDARPTILFAPGVAESLWFAEQFVARGVSAAHVAGDEVWCNGKSLGAGREARQAVLEGSRDGRVGVLCNRFVLREGIDAPWLQHGILATVFGSLQSYLQSGGRLLRGFPGVETVTLQDHGGNWWRHGSLNADRTWDLAYTAAMTSGLREDRLREKLDPEPARCPQCAQILLGLKCPCGFTIDPRRKSRPVIQSDGSLVEHAGDVYPPRREAYRPDTFVLWKRMYFRARNSQMTFRQALGLFAQEQRYHPPRTLPLMPVEFPDWFLKVSEVPHERLRSAEK